MSQVNKELTISNTHKSNGEHWVVTSEMDRADIDSILDPEGGKTKEMPTSIPSPFARLDLVRAAFANVYRLKAKASSNDQKLVSEALDVAQIFFNYENLKSKVSIIRWDKEKGIKALDYSPSQGHNQLGNALKLFLSQDGGKGKVVDEDPTSGGYNFDIMDSIFILKYSDDDWTGIIGGTSPSTLFFSAPSEVSNVKIRFNNDRLFDDDLCPLYLREENFQRFIYGLSKQPNFADHFKEVYDYIQYSVKELSSKNRILYKEIGDNCGSISSGYLNEKFDGLFLENGDVVEIIQGFRVRKAPSEIERLQKSEFILSTVKFTDKYPNSLKPMILQDNYQGRLRYIGDFWDKNQAVPSYDPNNWRENKRSLPGQEVNYPYLTVSDFLEPYIIRLVYPIDKSSFYDGDLQGNHTKNYVLPLTHTFFDFFNVQDIYSKGGLVNMSMDVLAGGNVKVRLSIVLKQSEPPIVFERIYKNSISDFPLEADPYKRDGGAVVELQFGLNIMPFIKITTKDFEPIYKIQILDRDVAYNTFSNNYQLKFFDAENRDFDVDAPKTRRRKIKDQNTVETKYHTIKNNFDYIQVNVAGYSGVLIPKFPEREIGHDVFTFAVDFGTTSSHIQSKRGIQKTDVLSFSESEKLIGRLHDTAFRISDPSFNQTGATLIDTVALLEWMPVNMGKDYPNKFPFRTVLVDNQPNWIENIESFSDANPAFDYHIRTYQGQGGVSSQLTTNLKWANMKDSEGNGEDKVKAFIESLLFMIRNKVLLNNGNLEQTQLVWFYPQSMAPFRLAAFKNVWVDKFANIISSKTHPYRISESIAPYYGYEAASAEKKIKSNLYPGAVVDIGGGSTDYSVYVNEIPVLISSMRFAGNSIFGDQNPNSFDDNGFVLKYKPKIEEALNSLKLFNYIDVLESIAATQSSEDLVSFFFSLKHNPEVVKKGEIDFEKMLTDDYALKIVFLVFYCAIVYHLAKLMKTKGLPIPGHIAFSGNGSKIIGILTPRKPSVEELAKIIFEEVYNEKIDRTINVIYSDNPKEITSVGGVEFATKQGNIKFTNEQNETDEEAKTEPVVVVLKGTESDGFVQKSDKYSTIDTSVLTSVEKEVMNFYDLTFGMNDRLNFKTKLGVNASDLSTYKQVLTKDIMQHLLDGLGRKRKEVAGNDELEETLFFYPIAASLNSLATYVSEKEMSKDL